MYNFTDGYNQTRGEITDKHSVQSCKMRKYRYTLGTNMQDEKVQIHTWVQSNK